MSRTVTSARFPIRVPRALSALTLAALTALVWATPTVGAPRPPSPPCAVLSGGVTFASARGSMVITGTAGNDTIDCRNNTSLVFRIYGRGGSDTIYGGGKGDVIFAGPGRSIVHGGPGNDGLIADGGGGWFYGDAGDDAISLYSAGEGGIAEGGDGNDVLTGSPFNDQLFGNAGEDTLEGRAGDDVLGDDSPDADSFDGGVGADLCEDGDGYGVSVPAGTVGYLGALQNDHLTGCEEVRVAASRP